MAPITTAGVVDAHRHGSPSQISLLRLALPLSKSLILTLVFFTSTGAYIRQLFAIAILDTITVIIALLWLLGDILPCLALSKLAYDFTLDITQRGKTSIRELFSPRSFLAAILNVFALLYTIDVAVQIKCRYASQGLAQTECYRMQSKFEKAFFHIQVTLSMLNLAKPWRWSSLDLRYIMTKLERFNLLAYRVAHSISARLDSSSVQHTDSGPESDQSDRSFCCTKHIALLDRQTVASSAQPENETSNRSGEIVSRRSSDSTSGGGNSISQKSRPRVAKRATVGTSRGTVSRRSNPSLTSGTRRTRSSANLRLTARRTSKVQVRTQGRKSITTKLQRRRVSMRAATVKGRSCIGVSDGNRTVNLNLNVG